MLANLLEAHIAEIDIEWIPWGEATMESELRKSGHQPDESYCFHSEKENPDLAIEIVITSGGIDKLGFYRQYEVPEVWFWIDEGLRISKLGDDGYDEAQNSGWFPDLDAELLTECVKIESPRDARKKFLAGQST